PAAVDDLAHAGLGRGRQAWAPAGVPRHEPGATRGGRAAPVPDPGPAPGLTRPGGPGGAALGRPPGDGGADRLRRRAEDRARHRAGVLQRLRPRQVRARRRAAVVGALDRRLPPGVAVQALGAVAAARAPRARRVAAPAALARERDREVAASRAR